MSARMPSPDEFLRNSLKLRADYEAKCREAGIKVPSARMAPAIEAKSHRINRALRFCDRILSRPPVKPRQPTLGELGGLSPRGNAVCDQALAVAENLLTRMRARP